jgi:hypothetical protein
MDKAPSAAAIAYAVISHVGGLYRFQSRVAGGPAGGGHAALPDGTSRNWVRATLGTPLRSVDLD